MLIKLFAIASLVVAAAADYYLWCATVDVPLWGLVSGGACVAIVITLLGACGWLARDLLRLRRR